MLSLHRRRYASALTGMLVLLSTPVLYGQATKTVKPNLIFILIDD